MTGDVQHYEMRRLQPQQSIVDPGQLEYWTEVFHSMDINGDNKVSYSELRKKLAEINSSLPKNTARHVLQKADINDDGYLSLNEFLSCLRESREVRTIFNTAVERYVHSIVPSARKLGVDEPEGEYEDAYSCCPPPLGMIIITLLEIIAFIYDAAVNDDGTYSEVVAVLIYDPHRRKECWRYFTYMFVHHGVFHLIVNLLVQIMLGIPLEMVHKWWRVIIVYLAGVVAGSLGTSIFDPQVYLVGASGGVYAIMTAHIATIIMNWQEMRFALIQLLIFLLIGAVDIGTAIYNRYIVKSHEAQTIGYAAHLAGAIAGLLVAITILRNLEEKSWERKLWWAALVIYTCLMLAAIIWNAAFPGYFPPQHV